MRMLDLGLQPPPRVPRILFNQGVTAEALLAELSSWAWAAGAGGGGGGGGPGEPRAGTGFGMGRVVPLDALVGDSGSLKGA